MILVWIKHALICNKEIPLVVICIYCLAFLLVPSSPFAFESCCLLTPRMDLSIPAIMRGFAEPVSKAEQDSAIGCAMSLFTLAAAIVLFSIDRDLLLLGRKHHFDWPFPVVC